MSKDPRCRVRLDRHEDLARSLAEQSDRQLLDLAQEAPTLGSGLGGSRSHLHLDGASVFVKRLALTDPERAPSNIRSTANLFDLPLNCHYGVGAPSFNTWRELAAGTMTTAWVRDGRAACFALMHHARVVDGPAFGDAIPDELADVERLVEYWGGSVAVRRRAEAIIESSSSVLLFLEYLPSTLPEWLASCVSKGEEAASVALTTVEESLRQGVSHMNQSGLFHFDTHLENILADDHGIYFADFGLATSPSFDLSEAESRFLTANRSHDACYVITRLVDWLVTEFTGLADWQERNEWIRQCVRGDDVSHRLPPSAAAIVERYAPIAALINDFYASLHVEDRTTPYPTAEAEAACVAVGLDASWK